MTQAYTQPALLETTSTLATLAEQINQEHDAARRAAITALEYARRFGALLIQTKTQIGNGGFLAWLGADDHRPWWTAARQYWQAQRKPASA